MPSAFAISTIASCSLMPSSSPVSAKPAVNIAIPATPFLIASLRMNGAMLRGTAQITRSMSSGTSSSFR